MYTYCITYKIYLVMMLFIQYIYIISTYYVSNSLIFYIDVL